ncbi:DUF4397 domain-containing protein [Bowmanella dokdonensis]|uniref:DUF4397 domain-containing protein n=1 Tax=Bowmanella dokdonensis TaxID=751969 RepID=A0A939DPM1_9ALTE|nr:DUF4397 domain-containing protein [Bowmanella dokdonensis]MBN7825925.1 DUF4397 domain-containing protein [Bowmanella dokdonensis]
MNLRILSLPLLVSSAFLLSACGGSSDSDSSYPEAYIQLYNGSANSASTLLYIDDVALGNASYGDATGLYTLDAGGAALSLKRTDASDKVVEIMSQDISLSDGHKSLYLMLGDYSDPELVEHKFERAELNDHFTLHALSAIPDKTYDLYVAEAGASLDDAHLMGALSFGELVEAQYWDGDADSADWNVDDYVVYLTEPGKTEILYESGTMAFNFETEYVMVIRSSAGASQNNLIVDLIINSTSVPSYKDIRAGAQYRFYNSLEAGIDLTATLKGNDVEQSIDVAARQLSDFSTVKYGDYQISASSEDAQWAFSNRLLTLNQGESKTVVLYKNAQDQLSSLAFEDSDLPQVYDHEVNVANLVKDYSNIDIYFVRQDETVETAEYKLLNLEFAESDDISLPSDYYEIIALYDDNSGNQTLLYRTQALAIEDEVSYVVSVEPDSSSASGYRVALLH